MTSLARSMMVILATLNAEREREQTPQSDGLVQMSLLPQKQHGSHGDGMNGQAVEET